MSEHPYIDFDGDGHGDQYETAADDHGHFAFVHHDGHGRVDAIAYDNNHDGKIDEMVVDENHDGKIDREWVDEDHDGRIDHLLTDTNGDGIMDKSVSV